MMQGSSSAPSIWLLVHLVIFTALAKATPGFTASCHDNRIHSHRKGEGFVDDTDLWVTQDLQSSSTTLASFQLLARLYWLHAKLRSPTRWTYRLIRRTVNCDLRDPANVRPVLCPRHHPRSRPGKCKSRSRRLLFLLIRAPPEHRTCPARP